MGPRPTNDSQFPGGQLTGASSKVFFVPPLEYDYDALGKAISADIMALHHDKHHQAYVDKLNAALADYPQFQGQPVEWLLENLTVLPDAIRTTVRNNGGGHYNHSLFWHWLSPVGGGQPGGELEQALVSRYGSFQQFVDEFTTKSLSVFGSGWAWLLPNMDIVTTANQDSPLMSADILSTQLQAEASQAPLLGLDVWEHAYYLDYKNNRADYVKAWWDVVNWSKVSERYQTQRNAL